MTCNQTRNNTVLLLLIEHRHGIGGSSDRGEAAGNDNTGDTRQMIIKLKGGQE